MNEMLKNFYGNQENLICPECGCVMDVETDNNTYILVICPNDNYMDGETIEIAPRRSGRDDFLIDMEFAGW